MIQVPLQSNKSSRKVKTKKVLIGRGQIGRIFSESNSWLEQEKEGKNAFLARREKELCRRICEVRRKILGHTGVVDWNAV